MYQEPINIKAHLISEGERIPIDSKYASKYSLLIRFLNGKHFSHGTEFAKLLIQNKGENVELGPCRFLSETDINGYTGRLIFFNEVYDLESLLFKNKLVKLQNAFLNLPLVLAHKNDIKQSFKNYTANLSYDLSVYKNVFDRLDSEYQEEPENVKNEVQAAIIETEGKKFMRYLDDKIEEFNYFGDDFSEDEHKRHGFYFRKQLWNYISISPFMARTNLKPRGYAGDSEMMRMIYLNDYQGDSTFAKLMHKHPIEHPAAQAVRSRRYFITEALRNFEKYDPISPNENIKILSVACGPVFEMMDILLSPEDCKRYHFTLLDQDREALLEATQVVDKIEKQLETKICAVFLNESVRTMLATPQLKKKWGQFNFIYSMGLFDYLTPPVATGVIEKLYQLLKPGGEMVVGNFHVSNPSKWYMEYWLDWVLYHRTEAEFINLLKDSPSAKVSVSFENTGSQMFLHVKKPRE